MLGIDLVRSLEAAGYKVVGLNRSNFDFHCSEEDLAEVLIGSKFVVNAAAYTQVDDAEFHEEEANFINGNFVGKLARSCFSVETTLFQISTDYVFDGSAKDPYSVRDATNPRTAYGFSKCLGEEVLKEYSTDSMIIRTSWLFGASGKNFPKVIARKLLSGETVSVVDDQEGTPTWTWDVSQMILRYMEIDDRPNIVHATASGSCSWFEFAREVANSLGVDPDALVRPVSSATYQSAAPRPKYSVLDNTEGPIPPIGNWQARWQVAAPEVLASLD